MYLGIRWGYYPVLQQGFLLLALSLFPQSFFFLPEKVTIYHLGGFTQVSGDLLLLVNI